MARIPRLTLTGALAVYYVISCTALDGFMLGDAEKEYLLTLTQQLGSGIFFEPGQNHSSGGCQPAKTQKRRASTTYSLFICSASIVARPTEVMPMTCVPSTLH